MNSSVTPGPWLEFSFPGKPLNNGGESQNYVRQVPWSQPWLPQGFWKGKSLYVAEVTPEKLPGCPTRLEKLNLRKEMHCMRDHVKQNCHLKESLKLSMQLLILLVGRNPQRTSAYHMKHFT